MAQTPAGWFIDPTDSEQEIYWGGESWTGERRPLIAIAAREDIPATVPLSAVPDAAGDESLTVPLATSHSEVQNSAERAPTAPVPAPKSRIKTWGVALAIVALVTAIIPGPSFATWAFAIPAILLGLIALIRLGRPRGKALFAVIGGSVGWLMAIIVSIVLLAGLGSGSPQAALTESTRPSASPIQKTPEPTAEELAEVAAQAAADDAAKAADEAAKVAEAAAVAAAEEAARGTISQQNARRSGEDYLSFAPFSRSGLIDQLVYEGFSAEDATWGVDALAADWNAQAAKSATSYLDMTSFSHAGLVDQLIYEGYSPEQAEYGVAQTGL